MTAHDMTSHDRALAKAASEAADMRLGWLMGVRRLAADGYADDARTNIAAFGGDDPGLPEVLEQFDDAFAEFSDRDEMVIGRDPFASAHAAWVWLCRLCRDPEAALVRPAVLLNLFDITEAKLREVRVRMQKERVRFLAEPVVETPRAKGVTVNGKRIGRRKKTERTLPQIVLLALLDWHGWDNGTVTNDKPTTDRKLAAHVKAKSRDGLTISENALGRFLKGQAEGRHSGLAIYKRACNEGTIGALLARWLNEPSQRRKLLAHDGATEDPDPAD